MAKDINHTGEFIEIANKLRNEVQNLHHNSKTRLGYVTLTTAEAELLLPVVEREANYKRHGDGNDA